MELLRVRSILVAALQEVLGVAATIKDPILRRPYVLEATRLGVRLLEVQKQIEDLDLD